MTAQEFIKGCEHDGSYVPVKEVLKLMEQWAKLMCDKQKEICLKRTGLVPHKGLMGTYLDVDRECIINSPYPDELQGNN